jgi:5'-nucleotidase
MGRMLVLALLVACRPPAATPQPPATVTLHLAAINDFHGALYERPIPGDPTRAVGGLPWLAAAIGALRADHPDLLLIDGGDSFQGDWPVNASEGMGSVRVFDLLGVDATAIGNHEFDYGDGPAGTDPKRGALETAAKARNQWLAANIYRKDGTPYLPDGVRPWAMFERDGVKIGVIGVSTSETPNVTLKANVDDLEFRDVVATVRDLAPQVRAAGAQVVIVTGHLTGACEPPTYFEPGPQCAPDGEVGRLLTELAPGTIDVLVAGHAHTLLAERVGDTFVLEDRSYGHAIGQLDLVVGPNGVDRDASVLHRPWGLSHDRVAAPCADGPFPMAAIDVGGRTLTPDPRAIALITALEAEAGTRDAQCAKVGCATVALHRDSDGESPLGDLVADALLGAFPDADVALQNSGGLRADLPAGDLHALDIQAVLPFDNALREVDLTGAQLTDVFRIASSGAHGVLQVSGASYAYDPGRTGGADRDGNGTVERWERDRLCRVSIRGKPVDPAAHYKVVTSDFLLGGGDHLGVAFAGAPVLHEGPTLRAAVAAAWTGKDACLAADGRVPDPAAPRIVVGPCD